MEIENDSRIGKFISHNGTASDAESILKISNQGVCLPGLSDKLLNELRAREAVDLLKIRRVCCAGRSVASEDTQVIRLQGRGDLTLRCDGRRKVDEQRKYATKFWSGSVLVVFNP